jgi:thioredoxin-like negative regulator of GroEL
MDKHLRIISAEHPETQFLYMDA